jgi:hypothetical protein
MSPRGDVEIHSIWKDIFPFTISRIEFENGFADLDFTGMPM